MTYTLFLYIIISILILVTSTSIFLIIRYYRRRVNQLSSSLIEQTSLTPTMRGDERIVFTNDLLTFIDDTITTELINEKRFDIFLNQKSKNLDFDKVIERVSTNTFNAIQKDILIDPNLIVTHEYLMRYIQKKTFIAYFTYIQKNVADQM